MGMIVRNEKTYTGISSASLSTLTDVALEAPVNGQGLVYNEETQTWTNGNIASGGGIGTSADIEWGLAKLSADIEVATPVGYVIPFNFFFSNNTIEADEENHGFILKAGKVYQLEATVRAFGSNAYRYFLFYNNVEKRFEGTAGCCETTGTGYSDAVMPAQLIVKPTVDTLYTLNVSLTSSDTANLKIAMDTHFKVTELKSSVTYVDGTIKPWLYSEEETICGVYMGKPLYRKKVNYGALPKASEVSVPFSIENMDKLIRYEGMAVNDTYTLALPFLGSNSGNNISFYISGNSITINTLTVDRSDYTAYAILEYTKTTDGEGSGDSLMPYGWTDAVISDILGGSS